MFLSELVPLNQWFPTPHVYNGRAGLFQCQGERYLRHVSEKKRYPSPPSLPLFLARFPLLRAHIFHPGICHLSGWSICDLATGQVLSVGEFIRHMPVTPLSRIHFQINRPSPWAPSKREFLSRCAKLSPPQNIPISIITKRDSSKWMRPFPFLNSENLFSLLFFFFSLSFDDEKRIKRDP